MIDPPRDADALPTLLDAPLRRDAIAPSLQRQLYRRVREAILAGALPAGSRLPGSRSLAGTLGVSRNTVTAAYEQLAAEGFLSQGRGGTKVTDVSRPSAGSDTLPMPAPAKRLTGIASGERPTTEGGLFRPGVPALSQFPLNEWRRALDRASRYPQTLGYGDPMGELALRTSIARHLGITRGVRCEPGQIVVTDGAQAALSLCVTTLTDPGDTAWVEDPGYRGAKAAMRQGELNVRAMRVDEEGMVVEAGDWLAHTPRLVYTTPSHQYPCGGVLSVARRLQLIDAARRHGAWIIEDDYDSEFRHAGEPVGAMQGLVGDAPVVYIGTFSKTMFPALRIGFLVFPAGIMASIRPALGEMLRGGARQVQRAMSDFIENGHYARHLARMRKLYRERQQALRSALSTHFVPSHRIEGGLSGLHLTVRMPSRYPDREIVERARPYGIAPYPLSAFAMGHASMDNGLVLGYGNTPADTFEGALRRLSDMAMDVARPD